MARSGGYNMAMGVAPRDIVLSVRDLVMRFDAADGTRVAVLDSITFDVFRGETLVIMGGSGCGKSTLLNCLIGELAPDEGQIIYRLPGLGEVDLVRADEATGNAIRRRLGILFQSGALFSSLTLAENVALPLREHSHVDEDIIDIVVTMKLQQVRMLEHRDKYPSQLSGGQKKRAGLARATALDPEILFYDEPTAGLDPVTASAIDELIMDLSQKLQVTSVVVTHEMDSAFRIADRMIMLQSGRILRSGPRREFEVLRDTPPAQLTTEADWIVQQFLTGSPSGPLTTAEGTSEYERLLVGARPIS
jgi:phospholipid/cholesterol/gamma-HCH transport system ATP-binding protein